MTGKQIKESTLHAVPRAKTVGGVTLRKIFFTGKANASVRTIFDVDGLVINAGCSVSTLPILTASAPDSEFHATGVENGKPYSIDQSLAWSSSLLDNGFEGFLTGNYALHPGKVITLSLAFDGAGTFGTHPECTVFGTATIG